jgi:hypothetical protein
LGILRKFGETICEERLNMNESHYINLGRKIYNENPSEDFNKEFAEAEPVAAFLTRKGFYFEMGRNERLIGCLNHKFTLEDTKNHPKTYPEQTDESLLNEIQIMYDLGWDYPDKYGDIKL